MVWHHPVIRAEAEAAMGGRTDGASVVDCMVADLWANPEGRNLIHTNWAALTSEATDFEEAGAILGITVPTGEDEYGYLEQGCP
jgi:hypothetical protein